ncbi:MAG: Lrp/AsnC family transcriptional regulator, partial [Oscillospiraceae bacterium]
IRGYQAVIDWEQTDREYVRALIEVKVIPQKDYGFEEIAKAIVQFDEVESLQLMSGNYDFGVTVVAKTFKDVAMFVAHRLSPLEAVQATSTNFVLRPYKIRGFVMNYSDADEREVTSL